jgi:hypothetical protein
MRGLTDLLCTPRSFFSAKAREEITCNSRSDGGMFEDFASKLGWQRHFCFNRRKVDVCTAFSIFSANKSERAHVGHRV